MIFVASIYTAVALFGLIGYNFFQSFEVTLSAHYSSLVSLVPFSAKTGSLKPIISCFVSQLDSNLLLVSGTLSPSTEHVVEHSLIVSMDRPITRESHTASL